MGPGQGKANTMIYQDSPDDLLLHRRVADLYGEFSADRDRTPEHRALAQAVAVLLDRVFRAAVYGKAEGPRDVLDTALEDATRTAQALYEALIEEQQ